MKSLENRVLANQDKIKKMPRYIEELNVKASPTNNVPSNNAGKEPNIWNKGWSKYGKP